MIVKIIKGLTMHLYAQLYELTEPDGALEGYMCHKNV